MVWKRIAHCFGWSMCMAYFVTMIYIALYAMLNDRVNPFAFISFNSLGEWKLEAPMILLSLVACPYFLYVSMPRVGRD